MGVLLRLSIHLLEDEIKRDVATAIATERRGTHGRPQRCQLRLHTVANAGDVDGHARVVGLARDVKPMESERPHDVDHLEVVRTDSVPKPQPGEAKVISSKA